MIFLSIFFSESQESTARFMWSDVFYCESARSRLDSKCLAPAIPSSESHNHCLGEYYLNACS